MNTKAILKKVREDETLVSVSVRISRRTMGQLEQIADIEQRPVATIMRAILEQGVEEVLEALLYDDSKVEE